MRAAGLIVAALLLAPSPAVAEPRDSRAIWNSRCVQCHGDVAEFARKHLWNIDGQLHGTRHVRDMKQFLRGHYVRHHDLEIIRRMLLAHANTIARFDAECGSCHGSAGEFVENSLWVRRDSISSLKTGGDIAEFLATHRDLSPDDARFFFDLLLHVGNAR